MANFDNDGRWECIAKFGAELLVSNSVPDMKSGLCRQMILQLILLTQVITSSQTRILGVLSKSAVWNKFPHHQRLSS